MFLVKEKLELFILFIRKGMYIKIFLCSFLMLLFDVGGGLIVFFIGILVLVSYEIVRLFVGFMVIFKVFNL